MIRYFRRGWNALRISILFAGLVTFFGATFAGFVHPLFLLVPMFTGTMMTLFALTGFCPLAIILQKVGVKKGECECAKDTKETCCKNNSCTA